MRRGDAFGRALLDHLEKGTTHVVLERDDGMTNADNVVDYFAERRKWRAVERQALRCARGRCVDVGAGAGRVALALQERGLDAVAIDVSPGAAEACRRRGVRDVRVLSLDEIATVGGFDTAVLFGGNLGLLQSAAGARRRLRLLHRVTSERGRIVGSCVDPERTDDELHLAYQRRNRERGRLPGQLRLRVRYRDEASGWFSWLFVSPEELAELAEPAGWTLAHVFRDESPVYAAVLDKRRNP